MQLYGERRISELSWHLKSPGTDFVNDLARICFLILLIIVRSPQNPMFIPRIFGQELGIDVGLILAPCGTFAICGDSSGICCFGFLFFLLI